MIQQRQVYILPAFAFLGTHPKTDLSPLSSKTILKQYMDKTKKTIQTFAEYSFQKGHRKTDYSRWYREDKMYEVSYEAGFEPYVLMYTDDVPHYPELFLGWYYDKMSVFVLMELSGYQWFVLPDVYVVHQYHQISTEMKQYYSCSRAVMATWRKQLQKQYGVDVYHLTTQQRNDIKGGQTLYQIHMRQRMKEHINK